MSMQHNTYIIVKDFKNHITTDATDGTGIIYYSHFRNLYHSYHTT